MTKKYIVLNHIPRCGGSSLRQSFYDATYGQKRFMPYISTRTHANLCLSETPDLSKAIHENTNIFIDHSDSGCIESLFNLDHEKVYRILTIRNPIDRFISHVKFFNDIDISESETNTIEELANSFGDIFTNKLSEFYKVKKQDRASKAKEILKTYDFIFNLDDEFCYEKFNSQNPFKIELKKHYYNASDKKIVNEETRLYIKQLLSVDFDLLSEFYK